MIASDDLLEAAQRAESALRGLVGDVECDDPLSVSEAREELNRIQAIFDASLTNWFGRYQEAAQRLVS